MFHFYPYLIVVPVGINMAEIVGDAEANPEGLVGGEDWGPTGKGSRGYSLRREKDFCPKWHASVSYTHLTLPTNREV